MKLLCIIIKENIASCAPAAPRECPLSDFVADMVGTLSPKTLRIAFASIISPCGVEVA